MLPDNFLGIPDSGLLTSTAHQLRQRHEVELAAIRAAQEIARRRRSVGDEEAAQRAEALADRMREATPALALADQYDAEAAAVRARR
jgi:hypothetical protein